MISIIQQLNKFTKAVLLTSFILIVYGYLSRLIGIYFFWESLSIGWILLFVGIIGFLYNKISIKSIEKKNTLPEKIGIGFIVFGLLISLLLLIIIPFTNAYQVAKIYLSNNIELQSEIGNIQGFGIIPTGSVQVSSGSKGEYGNAVISLTVKGDKKFKDITVYVIKDVDNLEWIVEGME